jgi:hypothetical protein
MDGSNFDALARSLASASNRRGALRPLAAGTLAATGFAVRANGASMGYASTP